MTRTSLLVIVGVLLLLRTPVPERHLGDSDHGQQLAGAQQIEAGEHPFVNFRSTYGPLSYYATAAALTLSGDRLAGEFALDIIGYVIAYLCLFALVRRLTNRDWLAFLWTIVAVLIAPEMYKYYIAAGPLAVLLASYWYMERSSMVRLAILAALVAVNGLFRADYGAYTALAAATAIVLAHAHDGRGRVLMAGAGLVLICASPWLVFVWMKGGLSEYLFSSTVVNVATARSLVLPFPLPDFHNPHSRVNPLFVSFVYFWTVPAACLALALRTMPASVTRGRVVVAAVLAQLTLIQSAHRADPWHMLEAIPVTLVLAAWMSSKAIDAARSTETVPRFAGVAAIVVTVFSLWSATKLELAYFSSPPNAVASWRVYTETRGDLVKLVIKREPGNWEARTIEYLRTCTRPPERILALPLLTTYYHLSERLFAGGYMYVSPGYFTTDDDQRRAIGIMKFQDVPVIVDYPKFALDKRDARRLERVTPLLARYFDEAYVNAGDIGDARIRIRRDRLPGGAQIDAHGDPPCPVHADRKVASN